MIELMQRIEIITPCRARELLEANTRNRPVIKANLRRLCSEILNGNFKLNGETIKISKKGIILDGQHRLMAVVETGVEIQTIVVLGVDDDCFATIDQGTPRTLAAVLGIEKVENATICAALVPLTIKYLNNQYPQQGGTAMSKVDCLNYFNANKNEITEAASFSGSSNLRRLITPAYLGLLYFIFNRIDANQCTLFFDNVNKGIGLDSDSPEYILRERLITIATSSSKEDPVTKCAYFIFSWNAFRKGKKMKLVRWTQKGNNAQDFPIAV